MSHELTPLLKASIGFAYIGGIGFLVVGVYLTYRRRRLHPLLLVCLAAISISWIEAPYDWAMYAQFAPAIPAYAVVVAVGHDVARPAGVGAGRLHRLLRDARPRQCRVGRWLSSKFHWRRPVTLLIVGLGVGFVWALSFNGILGARLGVFYYGRVIPGLALWQGTKHQYPLYDALAMGVMMMVFAYILGRTDAEGRTVIETWAHTQWPNGLRPTAVSIIGVVLLTNLLYGAVFAPHLVAKLEGQVTAGPTTPLFRGVPNQPLQGATRSSP